MRILVIDDDRVFTEALRWRLRKEGHEVVYCQYVADLLDGWYEVTEQTLAPFRQRQSPDALIQCADRLAGQRYATEIDFRQALTEEPPLPCGVSLDAILGLAKQRPLDPAPDLVILDMMMPSGSRYSASQTDEGRETGLVLLNEIIKKHPQVPVVLCTVRKEAEVRDLVHKYLANVKAILIKPIKPSQVMARLRELFPSSSAGE